MDQTVLVIESNAMLNCNAAEICVSSASLPTLNNDISMIYRVVKHVKTDALMDGNA